MTLGEDPQLRYVEQIRRLKLKAASTNALTTFGRTTNRADNKSESALILTALAKPGAARSPKRRGNAQEYWL